jgi:glycerate 2-kinase
MGISKAKMTIEDPSARPVAFLKSLFLAAVEAALPANCVPGQLPPVPRGRTVVVGAGKAAAAMAAVVEDDWDGPFGGLVVTRYGYAVPCRQIDVVEAGHPLPDEAGCEASRRMLGLVAELGADDLVICLLSGGGSALLTLPATGISLADKQAINSALLRSGATITEINTVRKHISAIKGGRLALACAPAQVCTLAISDVAGDDLAVIASGPTTPDDTTIDDARNVLKKFGIEAPRNVERYLANGDETPKAGDPRLPGLSAKIVASGRTALAAGAIKAEGSGVKVVNLGDRIEGDASAIAEDMIRQIQAVEQQKGRSDPVVILSGGEATVTVRGDGNGGPNAEFLLALAIALKGASNVYAIAGDTDGIDGFSENAGAVITPDTLDRAKALGLDPVGALARNDSYGFFAALGDVMALGPTRTNVNDFRAVLVVNGPMPRAK